MAREAFVHAMSRASIVVALAAALGAAIAWLYLPALRPDHSDRRTDASAETEDALATAAS